MEKLNPLSASTLKLGGCLSETDADKVDHLIRYNINFRYVSISLQIVYLQYVGYMYVHIDKVS